MYFTNNSVCQLPCFFFLFFVSLLFPFCFGPKFVVCHSNLCLEYLNKIPSIRQQVPATTITHSKHYFIVSRLIIYYNVGISRDREKAKTKAAQQIFTCRGIWTKTSYFPFSLISFCLKWISNDKLNKMKMNESVLCNEFKTKISFFLHHCGNYSSVVL